MSHNDSRTESRDGAAATAPWHAPVSSWWRGLLPRERGLVMLAAALVALALLWWVGVAPALRTLSRAPAELDQIELQLQTMQRLAAEAQTLRATPPVNTEAAAAALKAASERLGDKGRWQLQGERGVLMVSGASTRQLREWLAEARSGARARPVEAKLARGANGYSGTLVVVIGGGL